MMHLILNHNNLMEKRKQSYTADELALAKSAAWAWLEHCSGSVDRPTPEFEASRAKFKAKQSRYKVEAMRRTSNSSAPTRNGSLLDGCEIEWISRQLDFCMKCSHAGRRVAAEKPAGQMKKKTSKGLSLLLSDAVACGSSMDEEAVYSRRRRPVVEVGCRPWQGIRS